VAALQGVGGTRNCDWWFTDDAVLIDTAGRYTTQDSHASVDQAAWLGFLRLLKKYRRRQPLNGVLVAVSLSDLSLLSEDERTAHAGAIRRRVRELQDELGVRIPVYVLFTKADLIAGFVEFFDNMDRAEREQVWGVTLAMDDGTSEAGSVGDFAAGFDALLARLNDRMLERVQQETDLPRRRLIYGFPQQVSSLREVAAEFLAECFRPSRLEARALLRGVYFTSGTQDGTPIDRLLGTMAADFGLPRQAVMSFSGSGRSYFLARLIRNVVFGEAALAGLDPREERRDRWMYRAGYAGCGLLLLLLGGSWLASYLGNRELIATVHARAATYNEQFAAVAKLGALDTDLTAVIPALDTLRAVCGGYDVQEVPAPMSLSFGLYQGGKLGTAANEAYDRALAGLLRPRLLARLEMQLQQRINDPDFLYQALKVYLILGRQGPLDRDLVMQWFGADLRATFPDDVAVRDALTRHATFMLRRPLTPIALNDGLIAQVRSVLTKEPLAEYSYNRIVRSKRAQDLSPWSVADNGGPSSGRVFQLRSGRGLGSGMPGIFTWQGYHNAFLIMLPSVTEDINEDSWVLGRPQRDLAASLRDTHKLRRDVLGLYLDDYVRRWDTMLADIAIRPFADLQQGLDQLSLLSAPASPLRDLLLAVDVQTQLSRVGAAEQAVTQALGQTAQLAGKAAGIPPGSGVLGRLQTDWTEIMGDALGFDPAGKPADPARLVDEHFKALHDFVTGSDGRPPALEGVLAKLQSVYQSLNQVAAAPNSGQGLHNQFTGGGVSPAVQLQDALRLMPASVAWMLQDIPAGIAQVTAAGGGHELSDAWRTKVLPYCEAFNRYPMVANSPSDVPMDDFARLLAPGGAINQFFDQYVKGFVDISQKPWRWLSAGQTPGGMSAGSLAEFERAAQIRDALFGNGNQVQVRFQLVPIALDPQVGQVSIDIAGQSLVWSREAPEPPWFQWPGAAGKTSARVTMMPANGGPGQVIGNDGQWALLRVLDAARVTPSRQPDKFRVSFSGAGGSASFELNASSVNNPFTLPALRAFRCPAKL
jgi:type VI secretion system protein ImpL